MRAFNKIVEAADKCIADRLPVAVRQTVPALDGKWRFSAMDLELEAQYSPQLVDITHEVDQAVAGAGILHGQAVLFCRHTTASVVINEDEPLLHEDIRDFLERLASSQANYRHDNFDIRTENIVPDHGRNAHAHLKTLVLGSTMVLPIVNRALALGQWQRIFMLEMDRPKPRVLLLQCSGLAE